MKGLLARASPGVTAPPDESVASLVSDQEGCRNIWSQLNEIKFRMITNCTMRLGLCIYSDEQISFVGCQSYLLHPLVLCKEVRTWFNT